MSYVKWTPELVEILKENQDKTVWELIDLISAELSPGEWVTRDSLYSVLDRYGLTCAKIPQKGIKKGARL